MVKGRVLRSIEDGDQIKKEIIRDYFCLFCQHVKEMYGGTFLNRIPGIEELTSIKTAYGKHRFSGCIGQLHVIKLNWKNFPSTE